MELKLTDDQELRVTELRKRIRKDVGYKIDNQELVEWCFNVGIKELELSVTIMR